MRTALPSRRECDTIRFSHAGHRCFGRWSRYADGRVAEVFLTAGRVGSELEATSHSAAIMASRLLQEGVALDDLRMSLPRLDDGSAADAMGALLDIIAAAPVDLVRAA